MKVHDAELLVRYCADIPARLAGIRRECAMLDDEVDTLRGMNMDGMPRGGTPGDSTGMMACKMGDLGIGDRLRELERQKMELQADAKLIQGQIDSLSSVHSQLLIQFYFERKKWNDVQLSVKYSVPHMKRLRNAALSVLGGKIDRLPERDALLLRALNARKAVPRADAWTEGDILL